MPYPIMQHFVTEMCTCVPISVTKWCIVGYLSDALWDLWDVSIPWLLMAWRRSQCISSHSFDRAVPKYSSFITRRDNIDGLMQGRRNSIANALELHLSCTNPSRYAWHYVSHCFGYVLLDSNDSFTHILKDCYTGTRVNRMIASWLVK